MRRSSWVREFWRIPLPQFRSLTNHSGRRACLGIPEFDRAAIAGKIVESSRLVLHLTVIAMYYVTYLILYVLSFIVSTLSLAASLWIIGEDDTNPFHTDGVAPTFAKCAVICLVATAASFIPYGSLLALVIWFGSVMVLFEKSFLGAVLVALVGGFVSWIMQSLILAFLLKTLYTGSM